jgi:hypothetical protein
MKNRIPFVCFAVAVAACGKQGTALERNRAGSGSGTLLIDASIEASNSSGPLTTFRVDIDNGTGAKVSGATVVVHNGDLGDVPLVETSAGSGRYVNSKAAVANADFGLDVSHPTGAVTGVVVGNPGMHAVNAPKAGVAVPAGQPVQVSWTTPTIAHSTSIETRDFSPTLAPDTGSYTIPAAGNPVNATQRLTIERYNAVSLSGGIIGSQMTVKSRVTVSYPAQ